MTPLEAVRRSSPPLNAAGACTYFHDRTRARGAELGLRWFPFYFLGRGGVLGAAHPSTVAAAFGWFHPAVVERTWSAAAEIADPAAAAHAFLDVSAEIARDQLAEVGGLEEFSAAAEALRGHVDLPGLTLYAGIDAAPMPVDVAGRAYQNVLVLRELRGSVHIVAVAAAGLSAEVAHAIRRPADVEAFGWGDGPEITEADRAALGAADRTTDELMVPMFTALSAAERQAIVAGAIAIEHAFDDSSRSANRPDS